MNKLKTFVEFEKHIGGNHADLLNKVQIMGESYTDEKSPFKRILSFTESDGGPILICNNVSLINESNVSKESLYNSYILTKRNNKLSRFTGESFIPKTVKNRNNVKRLTFPIVAIGKKGVKNVYETYNKFNKSENFYHTFHEKIIPKTKYEALFFRNEPIHAVEKINETSKKVNMSTGFKAKLTKIANSVLEKHKMDVYYMKINEDGKGSLFLRDIRKPGVLSESQANILYVAIYEDHYNHNLPFWFKNKMNHVDDNS